MAVNTHYARNSIVKTLERSIREYYRNEKNKQVFNEWYYKRYGKQFKEEL